MTQNTNPMNQCGLMKTKIKMKTSWWELEPYTLNKPSKQFTSPIFPQATLQPLTRNTFILLFNLINYDKLSYTMDIKHNKLLSDTQSTILQLLYFYLS